MHYWHMHHFKGHNSVAHQRAAYCQSVTADSALLCSCIYLHHLRAAQRQHRNTQASLFQPSYGTPRGTNRATSVPCVHHLTISGSMPHPARPMQSRAGRRLVPAGGCRPIRHSLLCAVTSVFLTPMDWQQPQTSASRSLSLCLIIARQFGLSSLHLWYPWNVRPSSAPAWAALLLVLKFAILKREFTLVKKAD